MAKVFRWIVIIIGTISILSIWHAAMTSTLLETDGGVLLFWLAVTGFTVYYEVEAEKKKKKKHKK